MKKGSCLHNLYTFVALYTLYIYSFSLYFENVDTFKSSDIVITIWNVLHGKHFEYIYTQIVLCTLELLYYIITLPKKNKLVHLTKVTQKKTRYLNNSDIESYPKSSNLSQ